MVEHAMMELMHTPVLVFLDTLDSIVKQVITLNLIKVKL